MIRSIAIFVLVNLITPLYAEEPDEFEQLFMIDEVNEGALRFLAVSQPRTKNIHEHINHITISEDSLSSGWVVLQQCHKDLDQVSRAAVTYNPERTRALRVVSQKNIDAAWVEGTNVELKGIGQDALLCIYAETQAFSTEESGGFILRNGPFMRKFLDGYYPLKLSMIIDYPEELLSFTHSQPTSQKGYSIKTRDGRIEINSLFEGRLMTNLFFEYRL